MRFAILISFLLCATARANPRALLLGAERIYMSSEQLTVTISPEDAELRGTFTFQFRQDVTAPKRPYVVILQIPIWFPEQHPTDPSVAVFWKTFPKYGVGHLTPQSRAAFERAVGLRASLGDQALPVEDFCTLTHTNSTPRWADRAWQQEAAFCCLVFGFSIEDDTALTQKSLTISYRQPLSHSEGVAGFYYLPVFQNLPKGTSTTDTNRYAITIAAQPGCSLAVTSGDQKLQVESGQSVTLSPRHHQAIRAVAKTQSNKNAAANRRPAGQVDGSDNLSATVAAARAFPAAVAELDR